jgi:hypothetical protein
MSNLLQDKGLIGFELHGTEAGARDRKGGVAVGWRGWFGDDMALDS